MADLPTLDSRISVVDIAASKIAIVDSVGRGDIDASYLQIDSASLSKLDASLLIGGTRSDSAAGLLVTPSATDIVVANSAATPLSSAELILAATDTVTVKSGSSISASGTRTSTSRDFTVDGTKSASGALLRVSNGGLVNITRAATDPTSGIVSIDAGASVSSSGSLTLEGTRTTSSNGILSVAPGGAVSLASGSVGLGDTAGLATSTGLLLSNAQLGNFNGLGSLTLKSYGNLDLYGQASVGSATLDSLTLDAASVIGHPSAAGAPAAASIAAGQVTLLNTSGSGPTVLPFGAAAGSLSIAAKQITIGAGDKAISGFADVRLSATADISAAGTGSLQSAATLLLQAARIDSVAGANQSWSALDSTVAGAPSYLPVTIQAATPATPLADSTALGSRLAVIGSDIVDGGTIVMKSGSVTLDARGSATSDGVHLLSAAAIDVGGATKDFQGTTAIADAGSVTLSSANSAVTLLAGSSINLSAAPQDGAAGSLSILGVSAALDGTLSAASASGGKGGAFKLDVATLDSFSALNSKLAAAGFSDSLDIRARNSSLTVAAGEVVAAHRIVLSSDTGNVDVSGKLDASAALGSGSVALYGREVHLHAGARIDASATSSLVDGPCRNFRPGTIPTRNPLCLTMPTTPTVWPTSSIPPARLASPRGSPCPIVPCSNSCVGRRARHRWRPARECCNSPR